MMEEFKERGFVEIPAFFDSKELDGFERALSHLYVMQARKIRDYREWVDDLLQDDVRPAALVSAICSKMEARDKPGLYQIQKMLPRSQWLRSLYMGNFLEFCAGLLDAHPHSLLVDGPALFVNQPKVDRLLYRWHSESLFYPKRRRFLNIWHPVFGARGAHNGTMALMPGSHRRVWDCSLMSEYSGWTKETEGKADQFVQLEIPENFLTDYSRHECEVPRGGVVIFDRNLVHTSSPNTSDEAAFSIVLRVWAPDDDLTLSGDMEVQPYGGRNLGRAGLVVRP